MRWIYLYFIMLCSSFASAALLPDQMLEVCSRGEITHDTVRRYVYDRMAQRVQYRVENGIYPQILVSYIRHNYATYSAFVQDVVQDVEVCHDSELPSCLARYQSENRRIRCTWTLLLQQPFLALSIIEHEITHAEQHTYALAYYDYLIQAEWSRMLDSHERGWRDTLRLRRERDGSFGFFVLRIDQFSQNIVGLEHEADYEMTQWVPFPQAYRIMMKAIRVLEVVRLKNYIHMCYNLQAVIDTFDIYPTRATLLAWLTDRCEFLSQEEMIHNHEIFDMYAVHGLGNACGVIFGSDMSQWRNYVDSCALSVVLASLGYGLLSLAEQSDILSFDALNMVLGGACITMASSNMILDAVNVYWVHRRRVETTPRWIGPIIRYVVGEYSTRNALPLHRASLRGE